TKTPETVLARDTSNDEFTRFASAYVAQRNLEQLFVKPHRQQRERQDAADRQPQAVRPGIQPVRTLARLRLASCHDPMSPPIRELVVGHCRDNSKGLTLCPLSP